MRRFLLVLALALLAVVLLGSEVMAAPSAALSFKCGPGLVGLYGLEVTLPVSDHFAAVVHGGTIFPFGTIIGSIFLLGHPFEYVTVGLGARYYFVAEGWRPFISVYGNYNYELYQTVEAPNYFSFPAAVGIEYQRERGFRFALELGGVIAPIGSERFFWPVVCRWGTDSSGPKAIHT